MFVYIFENVVWNDISRNNKVNYYLAGTSTESTGDIITPQSLFWFSGVDKMCVEYKRLSGADRYINRTFVVSGNNLTVSLDVYYDEDKNAGYVCNSPSKEYKYITFGI